MKIGFGHLFDGCILTMVANIATHRTIDTISSQKSRHQMDVFLLRAHQRQIVHQCHAAINAAQQANVALAASNQDIFWASIQNFLTAAANISKACWGAGGKLDSERQPLRESLGIDDNSPLANTDLRNHLEHYDERLDRWYCKSVRRNHIDFMIGPRATTISGTEDIDIFRFFDPQTNEVIFWGERYALQPLADEIVKLHPKAETEAKKPLRG
jgi:hypothetical protein